MKPFIVRREEPRDDGKKRRWVIWDTSCNIWVIILNTRIDAREIAAEWNEQVSRE